MKLVVFAKRRTNKDGKTFFNYLSTLTRKSSGETVTIRVKFREECGSPKGDECPMNIIIPDGGCNMNERVIIREDTGEPLKVYTLWVSEWTKGEEYEDHSMDDFE